MTAQGDAEAAPRKVTTLQALGAFFERPTLVMLALGFAAGLPNLLIFDTLSLWLRDANLSLEVIGFFSLATLSYSFKFLWAPLVDRTHIPFLTKWLGHRRSWMLVCQALIMFGLWLVSGGDPAAQLGTMAIFAVFVGFSSATQDIVIDAWRIEAAPTDKQGVMATAYQWGYRIATAAAGALAPVLAQVYNWNLSYAAMAALMLIGVAAVLLAPRETQHTIRPIHAEGVPVRPALEVPELVLRLAIMIIGALILGSGLAGKADLLTSILNSFGQPDMAAAVKAAWDAKPSGVFIQLVAVIVGLMIVVAGILPIPGVQTRPGVYLAAALGDPLRDFFGRYGKVAGLILALICLYRLADFVLNIMNPFYTDLGFTKLEIAEVRKLFGILMSMLGVFIGGVAVLRLGLLRAMVIGAFAGPLSNLVFIWLATQGHQVSALVVAIGVDNVATGFAGTCLIAYMSSLTASGFTATQYAFFSSLYALPGKLVASQSGRIVEGAARAAEDGGPLAGLKGLIAGATPDAYAQAMEKSHVSPAALGVGYITFFFYSVAIGLVGVVLAFVVAARTPKSKADAEAEAAAEAAGPEPQAAKQTT